MALSNGAGEMPRENHFMVLDDSITNFVNNGVTPDPLMPLSQMNGSGPGIPSEVHYYDYGASLDEPKKRQKFGEINLSNENSLLVGHLGSRMLNPYEESGAGVQGYSTHVGWLDMAPIGSSQNDNINHNQHQ